MSYYEKMKDFLKTYPGINDLIHVDSRDINTESFGLFYNGQQILETRKDILGNITRRKQISFVLYRAEVTLDDAIRLDNIGFLENLINWIENNPNKPIFGDKPNEETFELANNTIFEDDNETGVYQIQIKNTFYEEVKHSG